jgi:predicted permease
VGRLSPGATLTQVRVALARISSDLRERLPEVWQAGDSLQAVPTGEVAFNPGVDRAVVSANMLALGLVGLVLLIACANLASFLLARALGRRREVALRIALGATRGRLLRQLLTETLFLAVLGGLAGLPLALWILDLGMSFTLPLPFPLWLDFSFDWRVLGFTLVTALSAGVLVGLIPALQATRPEIAPTLQNESTGSRSSSVLTLSRVLVAGQMAVCVILLVASGLFIRSFDASRLLDPGFGREPTALLSFMIPSGDYGPDEARAHMGSFLEEVRAIPGVLRAGAISNIHLNTVNSMLLDVNVDGVPPPQGRSVHEVDFTSVGEEFFAAAGIPLLAGRNFDERDHLESVPVAIVNEAMAERFWPGESPLGRTIRVEVPGFPDVTVVGVVATAKIRTLGESPRPFIYLPYNQEYNAWVTILAVTRGDPAGLARELYRRLRERHRDFIVTGSRTLEEHIGVMLVLRRLSAALSSVFALVAMGLAVMGLYGVVSHAVARRGREVGIRMSLGASPGSVVALQLRDGMRLVGVGGVLGLMAAAGVARGLAGFLYGVSALDPVTFGAVILLLATVASVGAYVPARRSCRVNPVDVLKRG